MSYYYLFIIFFMVLAWLVDAVRKQRLVHFFKATAVCIAGGLVGLLINLSNIYHTWQYGQESMRGKGELVKADTGNQTNSGLERDYITQWSYGIGETWTLLVPNAKGGSHNIRLGSDASAMKKSDPQLSEYVGQWFQYWGDQPFTAGPVYVGAFVLMLFILGLFIVKGPMKWALLAVTVLSILLSWGKNFMGFTNVFIDYMPMYSKFRTVSSILVIAEFTIPLLAMLALKKIVDEPEVLTKKVKFVYASFALTGGFCLLFALMPTVFFDFTSTADIEQLSQYIPKEYLAPMTESISRVRQSIFTADCWRSLIIIVIGTLCLLLFKAKKLRAQYMVGALAILCLTDLWLVNKRYLNDEMFVDKMERDQSQPQTETDKIILADKTLDYRVLNLASNTFNENETSYYHKSIGGYHAAKLRRYQELIEAYISPEMQKVFTAVASAAGDMTQVNGDSIYPVLNMLNTRYFIMPLQGGKTVPIENPYAYGNAWFVDNVKFVDNANQELDAIGTLNLRHEAVADAKYRDLLKPVAEADTDSACLVTITAYEPNRLSYDVTSAKGGVVVFSEIFYPGWTATVDGTPVELGRVDYVLRALTVSPGKHKVELSFFPKSLDITESVAYASLGLLLLFIVLALFLTYRKSRA